MSRDGRRGRPGPATSSLTATTAHAVIQDAAAPHEASAWLRQQIGERVESIRAAGWDLSGSASHIVAPLGVPAAAGSAEDRTCDRCRRYVAPPRLLFVFELRPLPGLSLVGGLCPSCFRREVPA